MWNLPSDLPGAAPPIPTAQSRQGGHVTFRSQKAAGHGRLCGRSTYSNVVLEKRLSFRTTSREPSSSSGQGEGLGQGLGTGDKGDSPSEASMVGSPPVRAKPSQLRPSAELQTNNANKNMEPWSLQAAKVPGRPSSWATSSSSLLESTSVEKPSQDTWTCGFRRIGKDCTFPSASLNASFLSCAAAWLSPRTRAAKQSPPARKAKCPSPDRPIA